MGEQILPYFLKVFRIFLFIFIILIIYSYYLIYFKSVTKSNFVSISKGENFKSIIEKNLIDISYLDLLLFKYYYKIYLFSNKTVIHYGDFYLDNFTTFKNFLDVLSLPSNILNKITIVEGWTKKELNNELSKYFKDFKTLEYENILADTYYFNKNENFEIFKKKLINFKKNYFASNINIIDNKYNENEIMIIGSLLEKEGLDKEDKMKISSVIDNRINKNMKLQIDATVIYSITDGNFDLNRNLNYNDLKISHPYNTYVIRGLPPKPIAYVGTKTIDIILENYKSNYLFYFYDKNIKKHVFSTTYEYHKKKLNEYRKN